MVVGTEVGRYKFFLLFLPLYTRLTKKDLLDDFNRGRIMGYIETNPGVHFTDIMKTLDIGSGTLSYHLDVLEKERLINSRREGIYKIFYPRLWKSTEAPKPLLFFSTGALKKNFRPSILEQKIINMVEEFPGITQVEIAEKMGISKQSLNYHIRKLRRANVITLKREGGTTRCFLNETVNEA